MTLEDEVKGETPTVDVPGVGPVELPTSIDDMPGEMLEAFEEQKLSRIVAGFLTAAQLRKFRATKPKVKDYRRLVEAITEQLGLTAGE
ncbi:MAG: hypothetical protein ACK5O2_15385 [Microthrixaceae bacterium]